MLCAYVEQIWSRSVRSDRPHIFLDRTDRDRWPNFIRPESEPTDIDSELESNGTDCLDSVSVSVRSGLRLSIPGLRNRGYLKPLAMYSLFLALFWRFITISQIVFRTRHQHRTWLYRIRYSHARYSSDTGSHARFDAGFSNDMEDRWKTWKSR